jgi:hypothetical protein
MHSRYHLVCALPVHHCHLQRDRLRLAALISFSGQFDKYYIKLYHNLH